MLHRNQSTVMGCSTIRVYLCEGQKEKGKRSRERSVMDVKDMGTRRLKPQVLGFCMGNPGVSSGLP